MAEAPIGVDIEPSRAIEPPWSLLHPNERNALETLTGAARADAFSRLWTAKEAYLKALGLGFAREPTKIAIGLDFSILDEEAAPTILTRGWRRFVLNGEDFIAACVVLRLNIRRPQAGRQPLGERQQRPVGPAPADQRQPKRRRRRLERQADLRQTEKTGDLKQPHHLIALHRQFLLALAQQRREKRRRRQSKKALRAKQILDDFARPDTKFIRRPLLLRGHARGIGETLGDAGAKLGTDGLDPGAMRLMRLERLKIAKMILHLRQKIFAEHRLARGKVPDQRVKGGPRQLRLPRRTSDKSLREHERARERRGVEIVRQQRRTDFIQRRRVAREPANRIERGRERDDAIARHGAMRGTKAENSAKRRRRAAGARRVRAKREIGQPRRDSDGRARRRAAGMTVRRGRIDWGSIMMIGAEQAIGHLVHMRLADKPRAGGQQAVDRGGV